MAVWENFLVGIYTEKLVINEINKSFIKGNNYEAIKIYYFIIYNNCTCFNL